MRFLAFLICLVVGSAASAQVQQSGTITPGHAAVWNSNGVIADAGSATQSFLTSLGVINNGGAGFCVSSDSLLTAPGMNQLCFGASTSGPATISLQNYGTAAPQSLQFVFNGVTQGFPTVTTLPVVVNDYVCFSATTGTLQDCGWQQAVGAINQIPVWTSATALGNIAAAGNSVLVTNGSSVPSWARTLPSGTNISAATGTSLVLGPTDLTPTVVGRMTVSGTTASSMIATGQDATHHMEMLWNYNATPSSANAAIATFGYNNPMTIDASTLTLQSLSGGTLTLNNSGAGPTGTGAYVRATSPALVTPALGAATATSINGSTVSPGQYSATATNDNATAGDIGEYVVANCPNGTTTTVTITIAVPGVVTWTGHPFLNSAIEKDACPVTFTTTGALPTGLTSGTTVYVVPSSITANTFQVATTVANALAGTSITTTGSQSGTQTGTASVTLLGNATAANLTGLSLGAGDWEVSFAAQFSMTNANTAWTTLLASTSTTSAATDPSTGDRYMSANQASSAPGINSIQSLKIPVARFLLSGTTTIYGVMNQAYTGAGATMIGWGTLRARRPR